MVGVALTDGWAGFFGNLMKYVGIFHTAFGVVNLSSGRNFTVEYDAVNEVGNATVPIVSTNPDGSIRLEWYDGGGTCVSEILNQTYYNAGFQYLTTVNGTLFNRFLEWAVADNATHSEYELISAVPAWHEPWNPVGNVSAFINSSTCYDFNWRGMDFLWRNGAVLDYSQPMKHDFIATVSAAPQEVDYNDPYWRLEVNTFYNALRLHMHDSPADWLIFLEDLLLGNKFLHANQRYYLLNPMHSPYFVHKYLPFNLPGQ